MAVKEKPSDPKEAKVKAPASTALAVSKALVREAHRQGIDITNMKLQKLLYFAFGWSFPFLRRPLFSDTLEAWVWGPVVPAIYYGFREFGGDPIPLDALDDEEFGDVHEIDDDSPEAELIRAVVSEYGNHTASALSAMTHQEGSPWERVVSDAKEKGAYSKFLDMPNDVVSDHFMAIDAGEQPGGGS